MNWWSAIVSVNNYRLFFFLSMKPCQKVVGVRILTHGGVIVVEAVSMSSRRLCVVSEWHTLPRELLCSVLRYWRARECMLRRPRSSSRWRVRWVVKPLSTVSIIRSVHWMDWYMVYSREEIGRRCDFTCGFFVSFSYVIVIINGIKFCPLTEWIYFINLNHTVAMVCVIAGIMQ